MRELCAVCLVAFAGALAVACGRDARGDAQQGAGGDAGIGGASVEEGPAIDAEGLPAFPPVSIDGSRLRARQWVTADGARVAETTMLDGGGAQVWYDTELETPCVFQEVEQRFVCLPVTPFEALTGLLDADCQTPLEPIAIERPANGWQNMSSILPATHDGRCAERRFALERGNGNQNLPAGAPVTGVYEIGDPLDLAGWSVSTSLNNCFRGEPIPGGSIYAVGRRRDLSELVAAEAQVVDTGRRLGVTQLMGSDGSRETMSLYDTELNRNCVPSPYTGGRTRCVPPVVGQVYTGYTTANPAGVSAYADANCQTQWGLWVGVTDAPDNGLVAELTGPGSSEPVRVYRILGPATGLYHLQNGRCVADESVWEPSLAVELVAPKELAALYEVTTDVGPLSLVLLTDRQAATAVRPQVWDNSSQQACAFQLAADGRGRCFPAAVQAAYESEDCTGAIGEINTAMNPQSEAQYVREWQGGLCSGGLVLRPLGAMISTPDTTSERSQADGCFGTYHAGVRCGPDYETYYAAGEVIDPEQFVPATLEGH